jgi:hypothetical protein
MTPSRLNRGTHGRYVSWELVLEPMASCGELLTSTFSRFGVALCADCVESLCPQMGKVPPSPEQRIGVVS